MNKQRVRSQVIAIRLPLRRYRERAGVSTVEMAVLLATVVACVSIGVFCLGKLSVGGFDQAASAMGGPSGGTNAGADGSNGGDEQVADSASSTKPFLVALGIAFVIGCGSPLAYVLYSAKREKAKENEEPEDKKKPEPKPAEPPSESDLAFQRRQYIRRVFEDNMASLLSGELKARHVMSRQVTCVRNSDSTDHVADLLEKKAIAHVMVRDKNDNLVGIISKHDVSDRAGKTAADIMTRDMQTIDIDSNLSLGITQMICRRVRCLPVICQRQGLAGVITTTDILLSFQCAMQTLCGVVQQLEADGKKVQAPRAPQELPAKTDEETLQLTGA
ncbi:MAG: CBS domain-containing protein [Planctomycetales bacterium]|nr:CBS domain-containing protein [Planctomycetales bacterium]